MRTRHYKSCRSPNSDCRLRAAGAPGTVLACQQYRQPDGLPALSLAYCVLALLPCVRPARTLQTLAQHKPCAVLIVLGPTLLHADAAACTVLYCVLYIIYAPISTFTLL